MGYRTLESFDMEPQEILKKYRTAQNDLKDILLSDEEMEKLATIFEVYVSEHINYFPKLNLGRTESIEKYLSVWISNYVTACKELPSGKIAKPKETASDPALYKVIQKNKNVNMETILEKEKSHNLFKSTENVQGGLLEEYIATVISESGWFWCRGQILRAIDFCTLDGNIVLQIKNKNNTENSSSSNIRAGTTILKWHRLSTRKENGQPVPRYHWEGLVSLLGNLITPEMKSKLNEENYLEFLGEVASSNPELINEF